MATKELEALTLPTYSYLILYVLFAHIKSVMKENTFVMNVFGGVIGITENKCTTLGAVPFREDLWEDCSI